MSYCQSCADSERKLRELTAELETARRDAERYRWIRERAGGSTCDFEVVEDAAWAAKYGAPDNFDMNIDEAMKGQTVALVPVPVKEG